MKKGYSKVSKGERGKRVSRTCRELVPSLSDWLCPWRCLRVAKAAKKSGRSSKQRRSVDEESGRGHVVVTENLKRSQFRRWAITLEPPCRSNQ